MADLKISALNSLAGADLVAADVVAVVDDSASETKKLTVSDLIANGTTLISDATIPSAKILFSAGSVATASVADAGITTAKVADSSITAAKLADNSSVTLVSTLPASGDFTGQIALDTDDDKIYVWDGSAWDSVKGAGSINVVNGSTTGEINIVASTSGDTVTISATLDDTTAAAQFLAGPTGAGGTVGYRAIIGTDLPTATTTAKGGVIVNGNGLTMSSDTIAIDNTVTAETEENHIVQYDANGLVTGGRAIVAADVPVATSSANGIVKPGSGLGVTAAGELNHDNSVTAGTASKVTFDTEGHITGTESLVAADIPDLDADKITTGTVPTARIASDAVTADKLADRSTATIAETTPAGGAFIGQCHLNSITGDYFLWDGNVWQPIGISVGEIVLAGTYDASTNLMATVTSEGTALSFEVGSALPAASDANKGYYVVVSEAGTGTSPAPTVALNPPDFLLSTGTAYTEIDVSSTVTAQQASNVAFTAAGNISATNVQSAIEELDTEKVAAASPSLTGTVSIGTGGTIQFEGATANDFESTLTVVDPTADRTLSLPDVTGTLVSTGDTGTVTSTMILDGTIANADISASAEIAVSKLANGTARQLLQTDVAGTGVEFTSNIDVPGTLDVTGAATLDSTLDVTGVISADGKVKFPAGTASAPSFYSGTDTNTGLYFSAADEVSITTGGTQRIAIDSSGRLLVGTSSSVAVGSSVSALLQVEHPGGSVSGVFYCTANSTQGGTLVLGHGRGSATGVLQDGDTIGDIRFAGADGTDLQTQGATIAAEVDGTPGSNDMPGRLVFSTTADGAASPSERLRIDSSGNVGIGTSSPGAALDIKHNSASTHLRLTESTSGNYAAFGVDGSDNLRIYVNNSERMRILSNGHVVIGDNTDTGFFRVTAADGASDDQYVGQFENLEATAGRSYGVNIRAGSNSTDHGFRVKNRANDTTQFLVRGDGNVGIGTTSPERALVVSDAGAEGFEFFPGSSDTANTLNHYDRGSSSFIDIINQADKHIFGRADGEKMRLDGSGRLLVGTTTAYDSNDNIAIQKTDAGARIGFQHSTTGQVTAGEELGVISFYSNDGDLNPSASIVAAADLDHAAGDKPGRLVFSTTADGASSPTERLRIDSSGNVGIGDSSPSDKLSVSGGNVGIYNTGNSHGNVYFYKDGTAKAWVKYRGDNEKLIIGNTSDAVTIDSSGSATFSGTITDSIGSLRRVGIHSASVDFTLTTDHPGKLVRMSGSGKTIAVPQNVLSAGDMVTMFNVSTGTMTIEQGSGTTIYNSADGATGNRTVAAKGMVTLVCTASNEFVISGTQLS